MHFNQKGHSVNTKNQSKPTGMHFNQKGHSVNTKNQSKTTGMHFNQKGHSVNNMEITIIEKVYNQDPLFRKQREKMFIQKFNTKFKGLNKINGG